MSLIENYYKWTLEEEFTIDLHQPTLNFNCEWVSVVNGIITISKFYSWDGCSPKKKLANKVIVGTWDGPINKQTGRQWCYHASLVHDALYQFKIGYRKDADKQFHKLLRGFWLRGVYYRAVRLFGKRFWNKSN